MSSKDRGGLSKREYAKKYGKEYTSSSKSSSKSKVKAPNNSKTITKSYDDAISKYNEMLPALQAKYNSLLTQLESEKTTEVAAQDLRQGGEKTGLTNEIAKRGLTATAGDTNFDTQQGKLDANHGIEDNKLLNAYQSQKLGITGQQQEAEMTIQQALAALGIEKGSKLGEELWKKAEFKQGQFLSDREQANTDRVFNENVRQFGLEYALKQKADARAGKGTSPDPDSALTSYINDVNTTRYGTGAVPDYFKESTRKSALAAGAREADLSEWEKRLFGEEGNYKSYWGR